MWLKLVAFSRGHTSTLLLAIAVLSAALYVQQLRVDLAKCQRTPGNDNAVNRNIEHIEDRERDDLEAIRDHDDPCTIPDGVADRLRD